MSDFAYRVDSENSFEETAALLEKAVPERNFRILAVHDTQATLAEKGFSIEPLKIYEVCNAGFAFKALSRHIDVSLFMPCRIVIRSQGGKTVITLARPSMISEMLPGAGLEQLAMEVEKQLIGIIDEIK